MATPPPIPVQSLAYATPVQALNRPRVHPKLAFIFRLSIWIGVLGCLVGLLLGFTSLGMAANADPGKPRMFWLVLLVVAMAQFVAAVLLLAGAPRARQNDTLFSLIGGSITTVCAAAYVLATLTSWAEKGRGDLIPLIVVCLLFAAISANIPVACLNKPADIGMK